MTDFNLIPLLPEIFLSIVAMGLLILGVLQKQDMTRVITGASMVGLGLTFLILLSLDWSGQTVLNGMFVFDKFAAFLKLVIILGLLISLALSIAYLEEEQIARFEYPVLVLLAGLGMMLMVSASNLLSLYMALELQSLSLYVLAAIRRNSRKSAEAGAKYFILGALSSGMILFGTSLIYGFSGTLDFDLIHRTLETADGSVIGIVVGLVFVLAGLAFKISAVPFHMWTPDVYQGAPTSVTALFALVPKIAALGLIMRLLYEPFYPLIAEWTQIIYFLAVLSMAVGAFAAIAQNDIKRLMAYSSIGNMGYALVALVAGTSFGNGALLFYLVIYVMMTAGVFAIIMCMRRNGISCSKLDDLAGLSRTNPYLAYAMAVLMFSLSGIPPLAGFFGKLAVFYAAVQAGFYILAVLGVLSSVVAAYYYLRVIKIMFFDEPADPFDAAIPFSRNIILFVSLIFVVGLAFSPNVLFETTQNVVVALTAGG